MISWSLFTPQYLYTEPSTHTHIQCEARGGRKEGREKGERERGVEKPEEKISRRGLVKKGGREKGKREVKGSWEGEEGRKG